MIDADLQQLLAALGGVLTCPLLVASQRARRERAEGEKAFDALRAQILASRLESRAQAFSASVKILTCESRQHQIEDIVSCGVLVARLCVDCDKQIDAPEWLAA